MAIVNITVDNDADFYRQFAYQTIDNVPINLTGNTMKMGIRANASDVIEEMLLTTENGGLAIIDPVNGLFTVRITQPQLVDLPAGVYAHSLVRMIGAVPPGSPPSETYSIWSGSLTINPGPSR